MKKYENFKAALNNLKDIYDYEERYSNGETAGIVGLYEICFEQAWKASGFSSYRGDYFNPEDAVFVATKMG